MPLHLVHVAADWSKPANRKAMSGFMPRDRAIITHPEWEGRLRRAFRHVQTPINLIFLHDPRRRLYHQYASLKVMSPLLEGFDKKLGASALTVVFAHNYSEPNYAEMSPWMVAHRISHILFEIMPQRGETSTGKFANAVASAVGRAARHRLGSGPLEMTPAVFNVLNFKSARDMRIAHFGEVYHEVFAQWVINGRVTFDSDATLLKASDQIAHHANAMLESARGTVLIL